MLERIAGLKSAHINHSQPSPFEDRDEPRVLNYKSADPIDIPGNQP